MDKPSRGSWSFVPGVLGIVLLLALALTPVFARSDPAASLFPATPGAFDTSFNGGQDAFVAKLQLQAQQLHASMTSYAPDIDGDLGEWPPIESTTLNRSTASRIIGDFSSDADAEMTCRAMWDNANLYLGCQVTDDVIVVDSGARFWHDDAVELAFDGKHDGRSFCGDVPCLDDHKYELSADGRFQDYSQPPDPGVRAAVQQRSDGYDLEVAIPQSEFDTVPFQPYTVILGFNLGLLDDDDGGSMEGQLVWSGEYTYGYAWTYGDLRFWPDHGYPPPAATPTPRPTPTPAATSTPACQDPFEPDDQWTQAKLLSLDGSGQLRSFHQPGDVDYAKFVAAAGQVLTLRTDQLAVGVDTTLTLFDTDGVTQLAYNDDDLLNAPASRIEWTVPSTGTYFLKAAHLDGQAGGCGMTYELYGEVEQPAPQAVHIWLPLITK